MGSLCVKAVFKRALYKLDAAEVINGLDMRVIRFSLGQSIRRAFRLGFSIATLIAAQLILFISQAHALGLGDLTVNSYLDEPLDLRVELTLDPGTDNLEEVVFDLASRKEFYIAGISPPDFMDEIQFEILPENGKNWLKISSVSQMREPFLHLLIRAEWSSGSLLREYTALIDPPAYSSQTPRPVMAPRITEEFSSTNYANPLKNSTVSETYTENQAVYAEMGSVPLVSETAANETAQSYNQTSNTESLSVDEASGVYGPIEAGETLSGIVAQLQQVYPELGYFQTLYVLLRDNQEAFIDGNMNLLKKGEILRVESLEDIPNVPRELAVQVFQEQQGEWQSYLADRGKLAPTYVASESPANLAAGLISGASAQFSANDGVSVIQDQFRIGSAEGASQLSRGVINDTRALQSEISEIESSLMSNQLQNFELRERLELLQIQLDEVNQLIALEDPTLAVLQQGLGNTLSATPSIVNSTTNGSPADVSSGRVLADQSGVGGESSGNASVTPLLIVSEQSWFDRIMGYMPEIDFQSTRTLGVIGAAITALFALLFLRRRRVQEESGHSMLSMAVEGTHSQFDAASLHEGVDLDDDGLGVGRSQGKGSSFLTVYNDDAATAHSDDVDPLVGAKVYLAYRRDDQAIEVLKEGLKRSDDRFDIRLKLLEIYHKQENKAEFESLAEQFHADKKVAEDKLWGKVIKMGQGLGLTNPIFAATGDVMERLSSTLEVDPLEDLGINEKLSEQVSERDEGRSGKVSRDLGVSSGLDVASKTEESSFLELNTDLDANSSANNLATDGSHKSASTSKLDPIEHPMFSNANSGAPIRLDDSLSSDAQESNAKTPDMSTINLPSEGLSNAVLTASNSEFNVDLSDSTEHSSKMLTPDATAVGELGELSDFMISENASDAGSIQVLDSEDIQTQLDLAEVYVELGYGEGAGQILKDVMEHGNSKQKKRASEILSELNA